MRLLLLAFGAFYLMMAPLLFISWLGFFREEPCLSRGERRLSVIVIAIATLLWPFVVPIAYLEVLNKFKQSARFGGLAEQISLNPDQFPDIWPSDKDLRGSRELP